MKTLSLLLLCACSSVYAESRVLPPVIDNSTYASGSAYAPAAPSTNAMYEVLGRLEQLQHEVQQLRGQVEEQSQTIVDLKKRQGNIYSDLDLRLQELARLSGQNKQLGGVAVAQTAEEAIGSQFSAEQKVVKYATPNKDSATVVGVVNKPDVKNQKAIYQSAYETLRNGHNTRAIAAFKALLVEFPDGEYADNSQYWLGEAYKVNQDLNSAKEAFTKVVTHYGGSPKVPDALLKLGFIEVEQDNMAKARDYLTQVTVSYPGTTAAHLATKKLTQMGVIHP